VILVDSCVIFDHTCGLDPGLAELFKTLSIGVCGVVRAEVLHGARNPENRSALLALLNLFAQVPTPEDCWDAVGDSLAMLRRHGVTVPFADIVLAALAILGGHELWTGDAHFGLVKKWLPGLVLFQEPP